MTPLEQSLVLGLGVLAAFFASVLMVLCALLYIENQKLKNRVSRLLMNERRNPAPLFMWKEEKTTTKPVEE